MNTNFNVQYQLAQNAVIEVGYSNTFGPPPARHAGYQPDPDWFARNGSSRPYYSEFPNLGAINEVQSVANGNFNALLASVRTTDFHGFTTKLSYTWGHSLDDLSYARGIIPQNSYCLQCDYASSDFDIRSTFSHVPELRRP